MKHVANRRKIVSPLPRKSYSQSKTVEKKSAKTIAVTSGKKVSVKAAKLVAAKSAPVVSARNVKPKASAKTAKVISKTSKTPVAINKNKTVAGKKTPVVSRQISKPTAKNSVPKTVAVFPKAKVKNIKPVAVAVKIQPTKNILAKSKLKVAPQIEKPKAKKSAPKNIPVKSVKTALATNAKTPKIEPVKSKIQTAKVEKPTVKKIAAKSLAVKKTKKPTKKVVAEKKVPVAPKAKVTTITKPKKAVQEKRNIKSAIAVKEVVQPRKNKPLISVEKKVQPAKKAKPTVVEIRTKPKSGKRKEIVAQKTVKANALKIKTEKIKVVTPVKFAPTKKIKTVELPIEVAIAPIPKPKKKKVKPIGAAIFRGKKERYDFQVFPVEGEFEDAAAIFIISKRVVDRNKKAHHKMVCIGQTDSVLSELKKHRKGKCFKKFQANAISVLREENEQKRLKIESDLKSAHTIPCPHA